MFKQVVNSRVAGVLLSGVSFGAKLCLPSAVRPSFAARLNSSTTAPADKAIYDQLSGRDTFKHVLSRKTFLIDYYKYLNDKSQIILYIHHNNLNKAENKKIRTEIKNAGGQLNIIRNSIYKVYLRNENEVDPATPRKQDASVVHPLSPLLTGPTGIITIPKCDPAVVAAVLKVLKSANEKAFLIGAKVETSIFDIKDVDQFKDLPNQEQLHSQLAGILTVLGGAGLVRTLQSTSTNLYLTLEERRKDIDPNEE